MDQIAPLPGAAKAAPPRAAALRRWLLPVAFAVLLANSLYLYLVDDATLFYLLNVALHLGLGAVLGLAAVVLGGRYLFYALEERSRREAALLRAAAAGWLAAILSGALLAVTGATRPMAWLLYTHIFCCLAGTAAVGLYLRAMSRRSRERTAEGEWWRRTRLAWELGALLLPAVVLAGASHGRAAGPVVNPRWAPASMEAETPDPRLHPSSVAIKGAEWMPDDFFTETASRSCGEAGCHPDIYEQWYGSAHHFSSFNNQWYRKSIEYMQEVQVADARAKGKSLAEGLRPSQWCAGCHDPSVLLTGRWQKDTIVNQLSEAKRDIARDPAKLERLHSGLGCLSCHSAVHASGTMGQGGLTLEYPALHRYAENPNPLIKNLHNYLTNLDPGPHRKLFLKPLHTDATAEFCSSCHKVHLDRPVNNYRWIRGFNDYDPWQMSGVSGQGARSFYYPANPKKCADCHMPAVRSNDKGNDNGFVKSHRFPAANTAIAVANQDARQLEATLKLLTDNVLTVDIFALRRGGAVRTGRAGDADPASPRAASLMGDGGAGGVGVVLENSRLTAPLGEVPAALRRGESVVLEVVVRTRGMGHAFPGGTIDAFDAWVELKAVDSRGRTLMWSGRVEENGKGPVEPGAHFYRALLVDEKGNAINKRNAWAARAVVYANVIPPGAADAVHYRLKVPPDCGDAVTITAKVNYRKFSHYYTHFAYAGRRDPSRPQPFTADYDSGHFLFDGDTSDVSGKVKGIPDVPIVTMAETTRTLPVTSGSVPPPVAAAPPGSWERWNDYGIGLLRQRDFRGAAAAFRKVIEARPSYGDGRVHLGQTLLDDGQVTEALRELEQAVRMAKARNQQGKAYFHYARALFQSGRHQEAADYFRACSRLFPRDREVSNQLGVLLVSRGDYAGAELAFRQALAVDPEDITANFNLIKAYNGLRSQAEAEKKRVPRLPLDAVQKQARLRDLDRRIREYTESGKRALRLYDRFRADETAQQRTAVFKRLNPHDNNEAQAVHEHE